MPQKPHRSRKLHSRNVLFLGYKCLLLSHPQSSVTLESRYHFHSFFAFLVVLLHQPHFRLTPIFTAHSLPESLFLITFATPYSVCLLHVCLLLSYNLFSLADFLDFPLSMKAISVTHHSLKIHKTYCCFLISFINLFCPILLLFIPLKMQNRVMP